LPTGFVVKNGSKIRSCRCTGTPGPLSPTSITASPSSRLTSMRIQPPGPAADAALSSRLIKICSINGAAHWSRLWAFYVQNVKGSYWTPYDIGGEVGSDMAVIWCHRRCKREWVGTASHPPRDIHYQGQEFMSRSTLVFHKEGGTWRVVHAHFSEGDKGGPRPGGV